MTEEYAIRIGPPARWLRLEDNKVVMVESIWDATTFPLREARRKLVELRKDPHRPPAHLELERALLQRPKLRLVE